MKSVQPAPQGPSLTDALSVLNSMVASFGRNQPTSANTRSTSENETVNEDCATALALALARPVEFWDVWAMAVTFRACGMMPAASEIELPSVHESACLLTGPKD